MDLQLTRDRMCDDISADFCFLFLKTVALHSYMERCRHIDRIYEILSFSFTTPTNGF